MGPETAAAALKLGPVLVAIRIRHANDKVGIFVDDKLVVGGTWDAMQAVHAALSAAAGTPAAPGEARVHGRVVRSWSEGPMVWPGGVTTGVALAVDGALAFVIPVEVARRVCVAIKDAIHFAEEQAKAPQIAGDAGLLLKGGARFGITDDPKILDEAGKIAAWDPTLRKYMGAEVRGKG